MSRIANPLGLTDREVIIVTAWATGRNDAWTARFVGRSEGTIRKQSHDLFERLGVHTRTQATARVLRSILARDRDAPALPAVTLTTKRLASAARQAVRDGVDPALALSYVIWPPEVLERPAA